jgi:hypothetical protein
MNMGLLRKERSQRQFKSKKEVDSPRIAYEKMIYIERIFFEGQIIGCGTAKNALQNKQEQSPFMVSEEVKPHDF